MEIKLVFFFLLLLGFGNAEEELDTETCDVAKLSAEIGTYCEFDQGRMYPRPVLRQHHRRRGWARRRWHSVHLPRLDGGCGEKDRDHFQRVVASVH
jgi:hypothetical protein